VIVVRAIAFVLVALALQAGIAHALPGVAHRIDALVLPVVWFAVANSQRAGMLSGCAAGLAQDAWFLAGPFGLHGFVKTFLGWVLGGIGSRVDLNTPGQRAVATVLFVLAGSILEYGLRHLLEQEGAHADPVTWAVRAVATAILAYGTFALFDRVRRTGGRGRGPARRGV